MKKQLPPPPPSAIEEHTLTTITPVVIPITSQQEHQVTTTSVPDTIGLYELNGRMSKSLHPQHHHETNDLDVRKLGHMNDHPIVGPHHHHEAPPVFGERISYRNRMNARRKDNLRANVLHRQGYHHHRRYK